MRVSPLREIMLRNGAKFVERYGVETPSLFSDTATEYGYVRDTVGISDFSYMQKFSVPEESGVDFLDGLFAGNVARVRFGRILHTFLADDEGYLLADCYIANNDEEFIVLCESIVDDSELNAVLNRRGAKEAGLENLCDSHVVLGVDGYKAWAVVKEIFGSDVLGLPYLSIEVYPFEGGEVRLVRAGKTSEFGYLILAPVSLGGKLFDTLLKTARKYEGGLCGSDIHNDLRLEGRFFNIFAEGARVRDPLPLGLQWMIDFDKESFSGSGPIKERRERGVEKKVIGIQAEGDAEDLKPGSSVFDDSAQIATVEATCFSRALSSRIGLALFPASVAYSGLDFQLGEKGGCKIKTISMPPIMPKSLTVKLDEI